MAFRLLRAGHSDTLVLITVNLEAASHTHGSAFRFAARLITMAATDVSTEVAIVGTTMRLPRPR